MKAFDEIVKTLQNADNEGSSAPYWLIIDPKRQIMSLSKDTCHQIAGMVTGPFFCRADAEKFLEKTRYNFSDNAVVYCHSGYYSDKYWTLCKELKI